MYWFNCFGTIRNSTALKRYHSGRKLIKGFGTIRNSTALKHNDSQWRSYTRFWNHSKQHSSKTSKPYFQLNGVFWNHSKQHSSKTRHSSCYNFLCFGTIRNSTALKHIPMCPTPHLCFGTIRNSTALKRFPFPPHYWSCFGTIRNSTALKPRGLFFLTKFRNRAICLSQTSASNSSFMLALLYLKSLVISMFLSIHIIYSCNFFSKAWVKTSE